MNLMGAPGQAPGQQISRLVITEFSRWRAGLNGPGMKARPFQINSLPLRAGRSSGNSLAVRIPKEQGFVDASQDMEVERVLALPTTRIPVRPFTAGDAKCFGVPRAALRDHRRNAMDRLIAARALSAGVTLVTNNEADFSGYAGLVFENWAGA